MSIKIYNENRLTRQPFFKLLVAYLEGKSEVTLRQIHKDFPEVKNIDRQIDQFISAGLILRADRRYQLAFQVFSDEDFPLTVLSVASQTLSVVKNKFSAPFFVDAESEIARKLDQSWFVQTLMNSTNAIKLNFSSRYDLTTQTLANYFYKVKEELALSAFETEIYQIIGDVDPDYALKYMTTFLLKFMRKEIVKTKSDIFVQVLEKYGYVEKISEREYRCLLSFEERELPEVEFEQAYDFISAQIQQKNPLENFISCSTE